MLAELDKAVRHLAMAHRALARAGFPEEFIPLAIDVCSKEWGAYFHKFGASSGLFFEIEKTPVPNELKLRFGVRRVPVGWWKRLRESLREGWSVFRGKDTVYTLHIQDSDIGQLKNLLRQL